MGLFPPGSISLAPIQDRALFHGERGLLPTEYHAPAMKSSLAGKLLVFRRNAQMPSISLIRGVLSRQ